MNMLTINIDWQFFLGIIGALFGIAWYTATRFSKIEGQFEKIDLHILMLKESLGNLIKKLENKNVI